MLEINPHFRPSAKQLLKHKVFDPVRQSDESAKASAPFRLKMKMDKEQNAINYEQVYFKSELNSKFLTALVNESKKF